MTTPRWLRTRQRRMFRSPSTPTGIASRGYSESRGGVALSSATPSVVGNRAAAPTGGRRLSKRRRRGALLTSIQRPRRARRCRRGCHGSVAPLRRRHPVAAGWTTCLLTWAALGGGPSTRLPGCELASVLPELITASRREWRSCLDLARTPGLTTVASAPGSGRLPRWSPPLPAPSYGDFTAGHPTAGMELVLAWPRPDRPAAQHRGSGTGRDPAPGRPGDGVPLLITGCGMVYCGRHREVGSHPYALASSGRRSDPRMNWKTTPAVNAGASAARRPASAERPSGRQGFTRPHLQLKCEWRPAASYRPRLGVTQHCAPRPPAPAGGWSSGEATRSRSPQQAPPRRRTIARPGPLPPCKPRSGLPGLRQICWHLAVPGADARFMHGWQ